MNREYWDPMREIEAMLRGRGAAPAAARNPGHEAMTTADWVPAVDIAETAEGYVIKVELTEVRKEDVQVSANEGVLRIQGQRRIEEVPGLKYHRLERGHGKFARSFNLPDDVEAAQIRADYRDGMLYLHLPKHKQQPARAVKITVN